MHNIGGKHRRGDSKQNYNLDRKDNLLGYFTRKDAGRLLPPGANMAKRDHYTYTEWYMMTAHPARGSRCGPTVKIIKVFTRIAGTALAKASP